MIMMWINHNISVCFDDFESFLYPLYVIIAMKYICYIYVERDCK